MKLPDIVIVFLLLVKRGAAATICFIIDMKTFLTNPKTSRACQD